MLLKKYIQYIMTYSFMYHITFHNLNYFAMRHKNVKLSDILTDLDTQS